MTHGTRAVWHTHHTVCRRHGRHDSLFEYSVSTVTAITVLQHFYNRPSYLRAIAPP